MSLTNARAGGSADYFRKTVAWAGLLSGLAFMSLAPHMARAAEADTHAPHFGEGGVPQFEREPSWAKAPAAWTHGAVGTSIAIDDRDHVFLLSRPHALEKGGDVTKTLLGQAGQLGAPPKSAIPSPVIEFDPAGNVIQSWGGKSGRGYAWPSNEHGIAPGPQGSFLIVGFRSLTEMPLESQILRFTKAGKFVSAIGKADVKTGNNKAEGLNGPTAAAYFAKTNEIFVTDGYGNHRVVVFDADSGKVKRMWGAYGNTPQDVAERTERSRPPLLAPSSKPWVPLSDQAQNFQEPHDLRVSNDGLVYVADRGNRRIQVFTLEGKFVAEQVLGLDNKLEFQAINLDFSPDQRFLYVGGAPLVYILNRRTLEVLGSFPIDPGILGHHMAVDRKGNIFIARTKNSDPDGKPYGIGIQKYAFKGYSPTIKCCQGIEHPRD